MPAARAAAVAAAAFSRLCAPGMRGSAGSGSSPANSIRRAAPGTPPESPAARPRRRPALVLEDAQLRVAVGVERAVAVDVVRLEVEQHGDARPQRLDVLELERRELAHDPGVRRGTRRRATSADGRCCRPPRPGRPAASKIGAEQRRRRRLPVRAGDAEDRVGEQPRAELDLGDHADRPRARAGSRAAPSPGTPGLLTTRSTPSSSAASSAPSTDVELRARGQRLGIDLESMLSCPITSTPRATQRERRGPAERASPSTSARHPSWKREVVAVVEHEARARRGSRPRSRSAP